MDSDRPIILALPMLRALLAGRKTQVRRLASTPFANCRVGSRLWVKESFAPMARTGGRWTPARPGKAALAVLRDRSWRTRRGAGSGPFAEAVPGWWAPIHMPRWASRLTLAIEAVRHEPLQAITAADAIAEGLEGWPFGLPCLWRAPAPECRPHRSPVTAWRDLWDRLHGPGERWTDNPEVVVLRFHVESAGEAPRAALGTLRLASDI